MQNIYMDTEFTGLHKGTTLISIGLTTEDNRTFYAEFTDYDNSQVDDWIKENVIANLKYKDGEKYSDFRWGWSKNAVNMRGTKPTIARYLEDWFQDILGGYVKNRNYGPNDDIPEMIEDPKIQIVSDCYAYDFVLFEDLWGHSFNRPSCVSYIPIDISTMFHDRGIDPDISREEFCNVDADSVEKHNALYDAIVIKSCYHKLKTIGLINESKF